MRKYLWLILWLISSTFLKVEAQSTVITGKITEKDSGLPIPYANIVIPGTYIGTMSDLNGNYHLTTLNGGTSVEISAIGYKKKVFPIKSGQTNQINALLDEDVIALGEIEVHAGEDPAHVLLRKIIAAKKENDPSNFPSWQCRLYAKTEVDLKNVNKSLRTKKFLSQFDFVFNYIDSLEQEGKTFLPVFFNETVSNYYHDNRLKLDREEIVANKASGMTTDMITQFTGKMYEGVNVYQNYIMVSDIGLVSPVNNLGLQFYRYYLLDSTMVDGHKIYEMSFKPKLPQEPTFTGKFWVEDGSFALTKVEMMISEKANINFINNFQYVIEYQKKEGRWVPRNESMIADVDLRKDKDSEKLGVIGRKTNVYNDFRFEDVTPVVEKMKDPIVVDRQAMNKDSLYWRQNRPIELQKRESNIYQMVDSIKNVPLYKTAAEYIYMFYYGYRDLGKVELGPYYYMYSKNLVEGSRIRLGARTTYKFDQHLRLNGYAAYGFGDREWKYGGGAEYFFGLKPLTMIALQGQHDLEMLGKSDNAFMEENILTTVLSKQLNSKLNMVDNLTLTAKHEWKTGLMSDLTISAFQLHSAPFVPFVDQQGNVIPALRSGEVGFSTRYAPGEDIVVDNFERNCYANFDPVVTLGLTSGIKGFLGGDYNYLKMHASISDKIKLNPFGYSAYLIQAGRIWGDVPFPFLKIHEGNETYAFDTYAFNLMNYQEFISDAYLSLAWEHHFQGFFLNKIPLFRQLKWREIVGVRALEGHFAQSRHDSLLLPGVMKGLSNTPYTELSVGLENILKLIRVDAVWRFNYNESSKQQLGLLFSLQLTL